MALTVAAFLVVAEIAEAAAVEALAAKKAEVASDTTILNRPSLLMGADFLLDTFLLGGGLLGGLLFRTC